MAVAAAETKETVFACALAALFFIVASPSLPARADGFGLAPKVIAPGKTVVLPEKTSSADITAEKARIVPHKAKENFLEGCVTISGEPCEGSPAWEKAQQQQTKKILDV